MMKRYTTVNRWGFASVNGHRVLMTQSQAERYAAAQLKLFPDAKTEVYCLSDQELVNGAMRWPEMTESMEAVLCK